MINIHILTNPKFTEFNTILQLKIYKYSHHIITDFTGSMPVRRMAASSLLHKKNLIFTI